jgi:hypothetical protein
VTTIWKFPVELADRQVVRMPAGAALLTSQYQYGRLNLWAEVDPSADLEDRVIAIVGTGNPMPEAETVHVATVQQMDGQLVWHVFEVKP